MYLSLLQTVLRTYGDMDVAEQKFLEEVNQMWHQDFVDTIRQVGCEVVVVVVVVVAVVRCDAWCAVRGAAAHNKINHSATHA